MLKVYSFFILTLFNNFNFMLMETVISHPTSDKIIGKYIDLSMELTTLFKDTTIDPAKLHKLAEDMISFEDDESKVQKILDKFYEKLPEMQQKEFAELYYNKIKIDFITKKVHRILGFYLTRNQISRLRTVLETTQSMGANREEMLEAMVEELAKDYNREKSRKAIEMTIKDLVMFTKKNPGWVETVEKPFHNYLVHDEM